MADVVHWHSRRIAACVFMLIAGEETESAGEIERFGRNCIDEAVSPLALPFFCLIFVSLYAADETPHRSGQF